jgi:hypothetical protein
MATSHTAATHLPYLGESQMGARIGVAVKHPLVTGPSR